LLPRHGPGPTIRRSHAPCTRTRRLRASASLSSRLPKAGYDAFEEVADLATSAKGYVAEASGHVTIVVDRKGRALVGVHRRTAASETIHEAVLAVKTKPTIDVLADTIHAFPTTARVMGLLFSQALLTLDRPPQ